MTLLGREGKRSARLLRAACVVLPVILFVGLAWVDYRVEFARTRIDVVTPTSAIAEHAKTVVETADLVIDRVLDHIDGQDWTILSTSLETHAFLDRLHHELPQVEAVYLIDPDGMLSASSRAWPMPRYDLHATEYFVAAKAAHGIVITAPSAVTISGTTGFMISRRRMRDGKFDGVVGVTISRQYFENYYQAMLDHPRASAAALILTDGAILVRFPAISEKMANGFASRHLMTIIRAGEESGVLTGRSALDGRERIAAFKQLHDLPLVVSYAIDASVPLTTWFIHAAAIGVCAMLLSVLLLTTEHLVRRQTTIEHDALRRLVDETERRREAEARAQQSQKMEALGRLTGGVAHDFNNLLTAVLGSLELVLRRETDPRSVRLLRTAKEAAERGAKLTAAMLSFARKQDFAIQPIDVNKLIRGMEELLRRTLGPSVRLHFDLAEGLWPAFADPAQLELALLNLAVNARDAMPNGGELTFRTAPTAADEPIPATVAPRGEDHIAIRVIDTGVGMSDEVRARAHEPFFTTKGPGGGTGLGLSMVDGFVSGVGGGLTVESALGEGTTVTLILPRSAHVPAVEAPVPTAEPPANGGGRILLVDDDASVRQSVGAMLEELGHNVTEADSGEEALRVLAHDRRFELLIIDFAMPRMNGAELATEITKLWPNAPLLFSTGYVENDALRPWLEIGHQALSKPFNSRDLAVAIERARRQPATAF